MDGWVDGWMDGWMNGWGWLDLGGWMDGWMDGWMGVDALHGQKMHKLSVRLGLRLASVTSHTGRPHSQPAQTAAPDTYYCLLLGARRSL